MRRLLAAAFLLVLGTLPGFAASTGQLNFWQPDYSFDKDMPACGDPAPLEQIMARFSEKEMLYWKSDMRIDGIHHPHEVRGRWAEGTIPRRWCEARARLSDGRWRKVWYMIAEDFGMFGNEWGVEFCVEGYDRNWAYAPACRMAKP
jgi:hypothetical protein